MRNNRWVRTALASWERLRVTNGNLYAAAITFFSLLALFPMLLLAVSIAGFVLHANPAELQKLFDTLSRNAPGQVGDTLHQSIEAAIRARASLGIVGLVGVLLTGLGWIGNLRLATDAVWELEPLKQNPVKQRAVNLLVLALLGGALVLSLGLTAVWSALSHDVLRWLNLDHVTGMGTALTVVGVLVTLASDVVIFFLVLTRLPRVDVPARYGLQGAVLAAVGFEILKIAGTYTIALSSGSATAGPFASLLAILVWVQLVSRWILFCTAWTAESTLRDRPRPAPALPPVAAPPPLEEEEPAALSPVAVGAGLVGAGAVAGAAVTAYTLRRRP
ncbi:MAG TPA: YhjD/YihY/BrkB family envelope integrity protein [Jatrophihabitantaceae bacterium]